jgi:HK97 family phage prohead protease
MSGLTYRSLQLDRAAADAEARTVPASLSSEEPYERFGGSEILVHNPDAIDLTRAADGLPLLFSHLHEQPIGLVEGVKLDGRRLVGSLRFGTSAKAEEVWRDVQAGILRNLSVGYRVIESETTPTGWRVTRWAPHECSVVSVPADPSVGINRSFFQGAITMEQQVNREHDIRDLVRAGNLDGAFADDLLARNLDVEQARAAVMEHIAERSASYGITSRTQPDPADPANRARAMGEALAWRFAGIAPCDAAREFVGMRIADMARELLEARGHRTARMSPSAIIERALHTTSDFPSLLLGTGERILRNGYLSYVAGLKRASRETTARDFRAKQRLMLGEMPALLKVNEGGEFTSGSAAESAESYALATYGRIFSISRQALVNDDLGAFATVAGKFGRATAEYEAGHLVDLLASNPTMADDSTALFHANHGNLAGSGGAISVTTLGAAKKAMRLQKGLDGTTPIDATPRYLIVPAALETVALQYLTQITPADSAKVNPFANTLELVVDPRLDAKSETAWYLAADPATVDGLEHAYLEGQAGPYVELRNGFEVDAVQIKCRLDFGAGFVDWRGWYRNPGA